MRKIIVLSMITLDGVIQAPGFKFGGWVAPHFDEVYGSLGKTAETCRSYFGQKNI